MTPPLIAALLLGLLIVAAVAAVRTVIRRRVPIWQFESCHVDQDTGIVSANGCMNVDTGAPRNPRDPVYIEANGRRIEMTIVRVNGTYNVDGTSTIKWEAQDARTWTAQHRAVIQ